MSTPSFIEVLISELTLGPYKQQVVCVCSPAPTDSTHMARPVG